MVTALLPTDTVLWEWTLLPEMHNKCLPTENMIYQSNKMYFLKRCPFLCSCYSPSDYNVIVLLSLSFLTAVLYFLLQVSFLVDEGVSPVLLQLLSCALCGSKVLAASSSGGSSSGAGASQSSQSKSSSKKSKKEDKEKDKEGNHYLSQEQIITYVCFVEWCASLYLKVGKMLTLSDYCVIEWYSEISGITLLPGRQPSVFRNRRVFGFHLYRCSVPIPLVNVSIDFNVAKYLFR